MDFFNTLGFSNNLEFDDGGDAFDEPINTEDIIEAQVENDMISNNFDSSEGVSVGYQQQKMALGSNTCSYCHGSGYYWSCGENVTCIRCGGSGIGS